MELEITEQVALGGTDRMNILNELKQMGLRLAMDDFGMGHSSLIYLKEFHLDTIKLDGSLVRELNTNYKCGEIIVSIVRLSRSMGIRVIAEYVETEAQQKNLVGIGLFELSGLSVQSLAATGQIAGVLRPASVRRWRLRETRRMKPVSLPDA